jgi:hypothetical protein
MISHSQQLTPSCRLTSPDCIEDYEQSVQPLQAKLEHVYSLDGKMLYCTDTITEKQTVHRMPTLHLKKYCSWSELPGWGLLVTGGGYLDASSETVRIDTVRDFTVYGQAPMLTARERHCSLYYAPHFYVLGGYNGGTLGNCERFGVADDQWEDLPPLPCPSYELSAVEVEGSLYALGGRDDDIPLDEIQMLSLDELYWQVLSLRLPEQTFELPCFKRGDTQVYFVVNKTLYSFLPLTLHIQPIKTLPYEIRSSGGPSYYCRGALYYPGGTGAVRRKEIGHLS